MIAVGIGGSCIMDKIMGCKKLDWLKRDKYWKLNCIYGYVGMEVNA